jgi:hypothetical protein
MAPRERFELPRDELPVVVPSPSSAIRDYRPTGLGYLGLALLNTYPYFYFKPFHTAASKKVFMMERRPSEGYEP